MRGVVFLDPYGMEIDWSTVAAIATTESLDLWYFFSLMGLYRQAANRAPAIDATKRAQPNRVLGTSEWEQAWYGTPHGSTDLFGQTEEAIRTADVDAIERYVKYRLESVFKGSGARPASLRHRYRLRPFSSRSQIRTRRLLRWRAGAKHILRRKRA
jgi:three-Cys-motif partner protein